MTLLQPALPKAGLEVVLDAAQEALAKILARVDGHRGEAAAALHANMRASNRSVKGVLWEDARSGRRVAVNRRSAFGVGE